MAGQSKRERDWVFGCGCVPCAAQSTSSPVHRSAAICSSNWFSCEEEWCTVNSVLTLTGNPAAMPTSSPRLQTSLLYFVGVFSSTSNWRALLSCSAFGPLVDMAFKAGAMAPGWGKGRGRGEETGSEGEGTGSEGEETGSEGEGSVHHKVLNLFLAQYA